MILSYIYCNFSSYFSLFFYLFINRSFHILIFLPTFIIMHYSKPKDINRKLQKHINNFENLEEFQKIITIYRQFKN